MKKTRIKGIHRPDGAPIIDPTPFAYLNDMALNVGCLVIISLILIICFLLGNNFPELGVNEFFIELIGRIFFLFNN